MICEMRRWLRLCEGTVPVNRHADIEALDDRWQQIIVNRVADNVMSLAARNKDWSRATADYYHDSANDAARQRAVDAWWEAGAPVPEIDGLGLSSDGPAFNTWARSYLGLPPIGDA